MNAHRAVAAALMATVAIGALATLANATTPGKNGQIAFSRYRFVDSPLRLEIWAANPDGSGLRQITHVGPNYGDTGVDWAPDGSRLVFTRCAPPVDGRCKIWSVRPDGSDQQMLSRACGTKVGTPSCPADAPAVYSPDGRRLAFGRDDGKSSIVISDTGLAHARVVFTFGRKPGAPEVGSPAWSPDGKRLAFSICNCNSKRYKPVDGQAVFVVNVDGTGLRRITPWSLHAGRIDWSPDGTRILFNSSTHFNGDPGPASGNLYTIRPDGTDLHQLTHLSPADGVDLGSYSPDGTSIVFTTRAGATTTPGSAWTDVFTINTDGTGLTPVTRTKNWEGSPDWGPKRR